MEILQKEDGHKGAFYVRGEHGNLAEMSYVWAGTDRIIIDHTDVSPALKGLGIGKQMVVKAVAFAREKGIKIVPLCPFARSVFSKVKELNDVL